MSSQEKKRSYGSRISSELCRDIEALSPALKVQPDFGSNSIRVSVLTELEIENRYSKLVRELKEFILKEREEITFQDMEDILVALVLAKEHLDSGNQREADIGLMLSEQLWQVFLSGNFALAVEKRKREAKAREFFVTHAKAL